MGYNLIKNFIDEKTRTKIHILGPDWREELQKYIAPDQIPQAYGGTRCEPDPWCTAYVCIPTCEPAWLLGVCDCFSAFRVRVSS